MKTILQILSSLKATLVLLILVAIWFCSGALLSVSSQYGQTFRALNHQLVWKSLFNLPHVPTYHWSPLFNFNQVQHELLSGLPAPTDLVQLWLWGIFLLGFFLSINLILGCKDWIADLFRKRLDLRRSYLLAMHLVFLIVLFAHLSSALWGVKVVGDIPVKSGQTLHLPDDYLLQVDKTNSQTPMNNEASQHGHAYWTPDGFRYTRTTLKVTLFKKEQPLVSGHIKEFEPIRLHNFDITLTPFSFRSQVSHDFLSTGTGERIVVHQNPGTPIMLIFQPIWILILLCYSVLILWRTRKSPLRNAL
jgi:hypothetical protein